MSDTSEPATTTYVSPEPLEPQPASTITYTPETSGPLEEAALKEPKELDWVPSMKPHEPWMCHAHRSTDGELCRKPAVHAGVCLTHGASAKQVKEAAEARLQAMVPKANNALEELLDQTDHLPTRLGAIKEVHDRVLGQVRDANRATSAVQINLGVWGSPSPRVAVQVQSQEEDPLEGELGAQESDEASED